MNRNIKIVYHFFKANQYRVFAGLYDRYDTDQAIIAKNSQLLVELLPLHVTKYKNHKSFFETLEAYKPDIYVTCSSIKSNLIQKINKDFFSVYLAHGELNNSKTCIDSIKSSNFLHNFDIICCGSNRYKKMLHRYLNIPKYKIFTNAFIPYDVLYNEMSNAECNYKNVVNSSSISNPSKVITLFSPQSNSRFLNNIMDYYRCAVHLAELAKENNWLIAIKPKDSGLDNKIYSNYDLWDEDIYLKYLGLKYNKFVIFCDPNLLAYKYLSTDVSIITSRTTLEIEASLAQVPLISYKTNPKDDDAFKTITNGCSRLVSDIDDLEYVIHDITYDNSEQAENQRKYTETLGISFDGNHYDRVIRNIKTIM